MSEHDDPTTGSDDLAGWADHELVRALRAPGSEAELAEEQQYAAAFRDSGPGTGPVPLSPRSARRLSARRLGAGGTAVVVTVALSSGVAAAYTGNLPDPVQQLAHTVIGAPAPEPATPRTAPGRDRQEEQPSPSAPESADPAPEAGPSPAEAAPSERPRAGDSGGAAVAPARPGRQAGESAGADDGAPEPSPSPSPPPVVRPVAVTMAGGSHLVGPGATVVLSGQLTAAGGAPVPGHRIALQVRGPGGWRQVLRTATDDAGGASAQSQPVTGLQRYRWRAGPGLHSRPWRVRVKPTVAASAAVGDTVTTINATVAGAQTGDRVVFYAVVRRSPVVVGRGQVTEAGTAQLEVRTPKRRRAFAVRVLPTRDHAGARARVVVRPAGG